MFYTIYKTTNIINGKFYIGKHKTKCLDDGYMGSGKILKHAISKYGIDNFHKEILHICKDEAHMNLLEKILVVPDVETNYNLCDGGKGGWGYVNKELREYMRPKRLINLSKAADPKYNHIKAQYSSVRMKQNHQLGKIPLPTFAGRKHSEETKRKIAAINSSNQSGIKNSQYGTCWITNGVENKKIKKEKLNFWLELGYDKGRSM